MAEDLNEQVAIHVMGECAWKEDMQALIKHRKQKWVSGWRGSCGVEKEVCPAAVQCECGRKIWRSWGPFGLPVGPKYAEDAKLAPLLLQKGKERSGVKFYLDDHGAGYKLPSGSSYYNASKHPQQALCNLLLTFVVASNPL